MSVGTIGAPGVTRTASDDRVVAPAVGPALRRGWSAAVTAVITAPGRLLRQAPLTAAFALALLVTTATLVGGHARAVQWVVTSASTNLHNMTTDPLHVLFVSAFWVESTPWSWLMALLVVAVMAPAELLLGPGRTVLAFVVGHVGATAVTVAAIGAGVSHGWLPRSLQYAVDVGPSYGLCALAAVLATMLPRRGQRVGAVAAGLTGLAVAAMIEADFTSAGHLVAAGVGLALAPLLTRRRTAGR